MSLQEGEGQQSLECVPANPITPKDSSVPAEESMQVRKLGDESQSHTTSVAPLHEVERFFFFFNY